MDRREKLRRLNKFRRALPHVTASALSAVLCAVSLYGLPDLMDRDSMRAARDLQANAETPYGPIVQPVKVISKSGSATNIMMAHPFASLWTAVTSCESFRDFFKRRLLKQPPSPEAPWNLVLYTDEVTPGNVMSPNNKRKFQAVYWTFLELGINALSREESWFCMMCEYSSTINDLSAGLSQAFGAMLKLFFEPGGYNFAAGGMSVPLEPADIRLWAKLGIVLQDGGAHKSVWHSRGDSASKLCLLCKNLFTEKSQFCDEDGTNLLVCNAIKLADLVPATDHDLRTVARYLEGQHATMAPGEFLERQQALGMTYHPHAVMLDRTLDSVLKPSEVYMHDWMHALFVDGIVNLVIYLVFEAFIQSDMKNVYETFFRLYQAVEMACPIS